MTAAPHLVLTLSDPRRPGYDRPEDEPAPAEGLPARQRGAVRQPHEETPHIASSRGRDTADRERTGPAPSGLRLVAGTATETDSDSDEPAGAVEVTEASLATGVTDQDAGLTALPDLGTQDAEAQFSDLFRAMHTEVRTFAVRRMDLELVDDVVGDTFLAVWHGWDKVPADPSGRRAWVYGVLRNKILQSTQNAGRRNRLRAKVSSMRPTGPGPVDEAIESLRSARDILDLLPPGERDAVAFTVIAGLSCAETAKVLGCSLSSVTTRVSRARTRLRTILLERATTEDDGGDRR